MRIYYSLRTRYFGCWILWEQKKVACTRIIEIGDENKEGREEEVMISVALQYIL
jgi:hypothetical protein